MLASVARMSDEKAERCRPLAQQRSLVGYGAMYP